MTEETLELRIERLSRLGEGVAHREGKTLYVEGAFPGEHVRVRVRSEGKLLRGDLLEVLEPSADRRALSCVYAETCGGCDWLALSESAQRKAKLEIVLGELEHQGRIDAKTLTVHPLAASPRSMGYRRRATLHWVGRELGFFGRRSHERVAVGTCVALSEPLADLPTQLAPLLEPVRKDIDEVQLIAESGKVALGLQLRGAVAEKHVAAVERVIRQLGFAGGVISPKEGSPRVLGKPALASISPLRPEVPLYVRPDAFAQANAENNTALVSSALTLLAPREEERVIELYSGNGNFTFPIAGIAREVVAVEGSPVSSELARRSAREGGVTNVRFFQGDVKKTCESLAREGERFTRMLVDPPRTGAPGIAEWALALGVSSLVYVACDPSALAKDAKALIARGFSPDSLQVVDMFPQTRHVEAVMSFSRVGSTGSP